MTETPGKPTMIQVPEWFERAFTFDHLQPWLFPSLIERLRGTPARLDERIARLSHDVLTRRDGEDWSIQEHAGHLYDLEFLWLDRLDDYDAGRETLTVADLTNRRTYEADHNADRIDAILGRFRATRATLVGRLSGLDEAGIARTAIHPRLQQPMRVIDTAYFIAEHDDHHLAQISALIAKFGAEKDI